MASTEDYKRQQFRDRLAHALNGAEDPLVVYDEFADWIVSTFGRKNPTSGLIELLEEATDRFKNIPEYKTNLRYLRLWGRYAGHLSSGEALETYRYLFANGIGRRFAALYLEFASLLEKAGRLDEAEKIYQYGIKNGPKRVDKLEQAYSQFLRRKSPSSPPPAHPSDATVKPTKRSVDDSKPDGPIKVSPTASINPRYAMMLAPIPPDKRPEKRRFDLSLLFTEEGVEYCAAEARARSLGLYGKQWGRPPGPFVGEVPANTGNRNMLGRSEHTRSMGRKSLMASEPTMTMNTKEALAEIYGMYNSPEKTTKLASIPMRRVDATPASLLPSRVLDLKSNQDNQDSKIPAPAFKPFMDENASTPAAPKFKPYADPDANARTPFITPRNVLVARDPVPTPNNAENQQTKKSTSKAKPFEDKPFTPFAPVFTPKQQQPIQVHRENVTEDLGKLQPRTPATSHQRALSQDALPNVFRAPTSTTKPAFTPFVDEKSSAPPRVFSLPGQSNSENGPTPLRPTFTPFKDAGPAPAFTPFSEKKVQSPTFTPFRDLAVPKPVPEEDVTEVEDQDGEVDEEPSVEELPPEPHENPPRGNHPLKQSWSHVEEDNGDDYQDDFEYEDDEQGISPSSEQFEENQPPPYPREHSTTPEEYEEGYVPTEVPLGGRFGQFNVMTPITERTFEFTSNGPFTIEDHEGEHTDTFARKRSSVDHNDDGGNGDEDEVPFEGHSAFDDEEPESGGEDEPITTSLREPVLEERTRTLALADQWTRQASFKPPNPCSPLDPDVLSSLLSFMYPDALAEDSADQDANLLDALLKFTKKAVKRGSNASSSGDMASTYSINLGSKVFEVHGKLGEGAFGSVFSAHDITSRDDDENALENDEDEEAPLVAVKVVRPSHPWEFHVLRRIYGTIPARSRRSIVQPLGLHNYKDESFLVLNYCSQGSLLDVVNNAVKADISQPGGTLDELLVIFFAIELIRTLSDLHASGFVHGDLKIDNCLVRLEGSGSKLTNTYSASGEGGWDGKGITLIDFGRGIDTKLFPTGQQFIADWPSDERDCPEILEDRPWTYQSDYYGLVGVVYCLLFGKYMTADNVTRDSAGRRTVATPLKRYWQTELWKKLFDFLLNPVPGTVTPPSDELVDICREMEAWLEVNSTKQARGSLKSFLRKLQIHIIQLQT